MCRLQRSPLRSRLLAAVPRGNKQEDLSCVDQFGGKNYSSLFPSLFNVVCHIRTKRPNVLFHDSQILILTDFIYNVIPPASTPAHS